MGGGRSRRAVVICSAVKHAALVPLNRKSRSCTPSPDGNARFDRFRGAREVILVRHSAAGFRSEAGLVLGLDLTENPSDHDSLWQEERQDANEQLSPGDDPRPAWNV